jgi:hypothetical protein
MSETLTHIYNVGDVVKGYYRNKTDNNCTGVILYQTSIFNLPYYYIELLEPIITASFTVGVILLIKEKEISTKLYSIPATRVDNSDLNNRRLDPFL